MKAGRAGSNPDDVTGDNDTQPLVDFLNVFGYAVFCMNTIVVGLDAVGNGYEKPIALDISWNPEDRGLAARKSRKYAVESVLVLCSEALLQYILAIAKLHRFETVRDGWNKNTSAADKVRDISLAAIGEDTFLIPAAMLMIHWRNRVVHTKSTATLRHQEKKQLLDHQEEIKSTYKNLDVDRTLVHFLEGHPTLKDVSSLISMSIKLARRIDATIHSSLSKEDLDEWIDHYGLRSVLKKVEAETSPERRQQSLARAITSVAPRLLSSYEAHYGPTAAEITAP